MTLVDVVNFGRTSAMESFTFLYVVEEIFLRQVRILVVGTLVLKFEDPSAFEERLISKAVSCQLFDFLHVWREVFVT